MLTVKKTEVSNNLISVTEIKTKCFEALLFRSINLSGFYFPQCSYLSNKENLNNILTNTNTANKEK